MTSTAPSRVPGAKAGDSWGRAQPLSLWPLRPHPQPPASHRFQEALSDFRLALAQLRGNATIDYTQLGLRFQLQAWEVRVHWARAGSWPPRAGAGWGLRGCCPWAEGQVGLRPRALGPSVLSLPQAGPH